MQNNKARAQFVPLRLKAYHVQRQQEQESLLLPERSVLLANDTSAKLSSWKKSLLGSRVKSASNSRYSSPSQSQSVLLSRPLVKKSLEVEISGVKAAFEPSKRGAKKTKSENVTPKRNASREKFPSNADKPDTRQSKHRRNLSLEIKNSDGKSAVGKSSSEAKLPAEKPRSSNMSMRPDKSSTDPSFLTHERDQLSKYLEDYYKTRRVLPATTSFFYQFVKIIGKGAFGKVSLAVHKLTGLSVAVKSIDKAYMKEERTRMKVLQDVTNMHNVKDVHVVRLLEVFESSRHFNMVMEYCSGGDLLQYVKSKGKLSEAEAKQIFYQVVEAVKACHSQSIIHRDVKLDNVLLNDELTMAKLCDFGVSRTAKRGQRINDQCGTPAYIAPEIIVDQGYDGFYVDLWSLGVLLYALVVGSVPFRASTLPDLHKIILRGRYSSPEHLSAEVKDLISSLLQLIPQKRTSLDGILRHSWFTARAEHPADSPEGFRAERKSDGGRQREKVDRDVLARLQDCGLPGEYVGHCLHFNEINHGTATYELLLLNLR